MFTSFFSEMTAYDDRKWRPVAFSSLAIVALVYLSSKSAKKYGLKSTYSCAKLLTKNIRKVTSVKDVWI
jgi:hypothetical protein